jgi:DNA-binding transcriptional LysR family regulator
VVDIRHLRCFVVVAEELHFGRAAARLHIAQPAVSQTVIGLERELGLVLFERTNRRVELTDAGRALLGEASAVLDRFDGTLALAERLRSGAADRGNAASGSPASERADTDSDDAKQWEPGTATPTFSVTTTTLAIPGACT